MAYRLLRRGTIARGVGPLALWWIGLLLAGCSGGSSDAGSTTAGGGTGATNSGEDGTAAGETASSGNAASTGDTGSSGGSRATGSASTASNGQTGSTQGTDGGTTANGSATSAGTSTTGGVTRPDWETLREAAAAASRLIGTAVDAGALAGGDARYTDTLTREFDYVTPENAMKWGPLAPSSSSYAWGDADAIVDFAEANAQAVKGHTFVWHEQTPSCVSSSMSAS